MRVAIVGAGISGLAAGWMLKKRFGAQVELDIFEASDRCGGWIRTDFDAGFLFEGGPRSCRTFGAGRNTLRLIEALGIEDEVVAACDAAKDRYLWLDGKLQRLPGGVAGCLFSPVTKGLIPGLWKDLWRARETAEDLSIGAFFSSRFGNSFAERLADPMVSGIFAGDMEMLSIRSCFPSLYQYAKESGSLIRGMLSAKKEALKDSPFVERMRKKRILSFRKGMQTLTDTLAQKLDGKIHLSTPVEAISHRSNEIAVRLRGGATTLVDHVILATPSRQTAQILAQLSPEVASLIRPMKAASVAAVNLGWNAPVLKREGFGYLVPSKEKEQVLGVVWDSSVFPEQNTHAGQTRLTVMMGGMKRPDLAHLSDGQLIETSLEAVQRHLGIKSPPDAVRVLSATDAIPQYVVGHAGVLTQIEALLTKDGRGRVHLIGSPWRGVAVNDCITDAEQVVSSFF